MNINEVLQLSDYRFIFENPHLGDRIMFLTLGGSHAYGTNNENSDIDIRGVTLNSPDELIGIKSFEQHDDADTDTVIYSFNKIVKLLLNCNPNTIEMLGCRPEDYAMVSPLGQKLIDNVDLFLSKRAYHSFCGYANSQLRRLQNAVARDRVSQAMKEEHIMKSMLIGMKSFRERYTQFDDNSVVIHIEDSDKADMDKELMVDINLNDYPLRELSGMLGEMNNIIRDYDKLNHRNHKKDEAHLCKHAMHLIRLFLMCYDILVYHKVKTYREDEHELLMDIRNGKYMNPDGTFKDEFFDLVTYHENRLAEAYAISTLPDAPDYEKVNEFVKEINLAAVLM